MIGQERPLPEGYKGYVFHRLTQQHGEQIKLDKIGEFANVTEWRKDKWVSTEESHAGSLMTYLECSALLNEED